MTLTQRIKKTIVFDSYWRFAAERQNVFFKRIEKQPFPWTDDSIIQRFKFTNSYRASDRTSQYLIKHVIYSGPQDIEEVFFRIILFKLFNKIETWEYLAQKFGEISYHSYDFKQYNKALSNAMAIGERIYSAAYIMPSGKSIFGYDSKHSNHLKLLERLLEDEVPSRIHECERMEQAYKLLRSYPLLGPFLGYQFVTDINYSNITNFSEEEFVVAGPGAIDGVRKCFPDTAGYSPEDIIKAVCDEQSDHFQRLEIPFKSLWGRELKLIDCQNVFCEISKYSRIAHPEIPGASQRKRIKQQFVSKGKPLSVWYPPKWKINEKISA